jgi:hypothetical protein
MVTPSSQLKTPRKHQSYISILTSCHHGNRLGCDYEYDYSCGDCKQEACAKEALALLLKHEWSSSRLPGGFEHVRLHCCPECEQLKGTKHLSTCAIDLTLNKAGLR